jgi:hypothetical protein
MVLALPCKIDGQGWKQGARSVLSYKSNLGFVMNVSTSCNQSRITYSLERKPYVLLEEVKKFILQGYAPN